MSILAVRQIEHFWEEGFLLVEQAVSPEILIALNAQLDEWLDESRQHTENYGETVDGKKRFDLDPSHSADEPRFRRIANPAEISKIYRQVVVDSRIPDMVAELIGRAIRLHHCKIICKAPGGTLKIDWHQDHAFDPHTNDDMLAVGLMLGDVTRDHGPVQVVPRSHRTPHSLYQDNAYTGTVAAELVPQFERAAVPLIGQAGTASFHHTWTMHASQISTARTARKILYAEYLAADAYPLTEPVTPSTMYRMMIRGEETHIVRLKETIIEMPGTYEEDSFFSFQDRAKSKTNKA